MPYQIAPPPATNDPNFIVTNVGMTPEHLTTLRAYGDELLAKRPMMGRVGLNEYLIDKTRRVTLVGWLPTPEKDSATDWMYKMGADVAQAANAQFWQYDLWGFYDEMQYLLYKGNDVPAEQGHFGWHQDNGDESKRPQRKLSFSIILSDPSEYTGGDLQFMDGSERTIRQKDAGTTIIFPSWMVHRVTPVEQGERRAITGWLTGPKFK